MRGEINGGWAVAREGGESVALVECGNGNDVVEIVGRQIGRQRIDVRSIVAGGDHDQHTSGSRRREGVEQCLAVVAAAPTAIDDASPVGDGEVDALDRV